VLVIDWTEFLEKGLPFEHKLTSMTIGVFDGVHRGHQALIKRVVSYNGAYIPAVITFRENHKNKKTAGEIQSFRQKLEIFEQLGVQLTLAVDFTESFRRMSGIEFLEILLKHGNIGFFTVGKSFRCGYQLDTDAEAIKKFFGSRSICAEIADEITEGLQPISSSRIRAAIADGDLALAQSMLGRPLSFN